MFIFAIGYLFIIWLRAFIPSAPKHIILYINPYSEVNSIQDIVNPGTIYKHFG